jgi:integrase
MDLVCRALFLRGWIYFLRRMDTMAGEIMPRPRPPHLHLERTRHGKVVFYFRRGKGARIRIRGAYGSPEFLDAYESARTATAHQRAPRAAAGTLAWLIARYEDSVAWARLSATTKRQRECIFKDAVKSEADYPFTKITKAAIVAALDRRRATPFMAKAFLKAMHGLFWWAVEADLIKTDPTAGVHCRVPRTEGFHAWTEEEIAKFETRWPIGSRERLALAVLLYTGLRRGDASMLGRQHIRDNVLTFRTAKTGSQIVIPILPELAAIIAATKTGDLALIATEHGRPMTKESFGNWFRGACRAAGVPGSAHGLRKAGATRAANNGATVAQLEAIFGWSGGGMASLYTRRADRTRLAREAIHKLGVWNGR